MQEEEVVLRWSKGTIFLGCSTERWCTFLRVSVAQKVEERNPYIHICQLHLCSLPARHHLMFCFQDAFPLFMTTHQNMNRNTYKIYNVLNYHGLLTQMGPPKQIWHGPSYQMARQISLIRYFYMLYIHQVREKFLPLVFYDDITWPLQIRFKGLMNLP